MQLELDSERFESLQAALIEEIIDIIRVKVQEAGLQGQEMEELTANLARSIASIIDDTSNIEKDGANVKPYLTFRADDDETLLHCGENAYTYEFVNGILKKFFDV